MRRPDCLGDGSLHPLADELAVMGEVSSFSFLPQTVAQWYWSFSVLGFFLCAAFGWVLSRFGRSRRGKITYREPDRFDRWLFWGMAVVFGLVVLIGYPPPAQAHDGCSVRDGGNRGWLGGAWEQVWHTDTCGPLVRNDSQHIVMSPTAVGAVQHDDMSCYVHRAPNSCRCTMRFDSPIPDCSLVCQTCSTSRPCPVHGSDTGRTSGTVCTPTCVDQTEAYASQVAYTCSCTPSGGSGEYSGSQCLDWWQDSVDYNSALATAPLCKDSHAGLDLQDGGAGDTGCEYFGTSQGVDGGLWADAISFGTHTGGNNPRPTHFTCDEPHGGFVGTDFPEYSTFARDSALGEDVDYGHGEAAYFCSKRDDFPLRDLDRSVESEDAPLGECQAEIFTFSGEWNFADAWVNAFGCYGSTAHKRWRCPSGSASCPDVCTSKTVDCVMPAYRPIHGSRVEVCLAGSSTCTPGSSQVLNSPCDSDYTGTHSCVRYSRKSSPSDYLEADQEVVASGVLVTGTGSSARDYYVEFASDPYRPLSGSPTSCACDAGVAHAYGDEYAPVEYLTEGRCIHTHESDASDSFIDFQVSDKISGSYCPDELAESSGADSVVWRDPSSGRANDVAGAAVVLTVDGGGGVPLSCLTADTSLCTYSDVLVTLNPDFGDCPLIVSGSSFQLPEVLGVDGELVRGACPSVDSSGLKTYLNNLTASALSLGYGTFYGLRVPPNIFGAQSNAGLPRSADQFGEIGGGNPLEDLSAPELLQRAFPSWYLIDDIAEDPRAISLIFTHPVVSSVQVDTALTYIEYMSEYFSKPFLVLINPFSQNLHAYSEESTQPIPDCPSDIGNIDLDGVADIGLEFPNPHDDDENYAWSYGRGVTLSFGDLVCGFVEPAGPWIRNITYIFFIVFILWSTFGMVRGRM